MRSDIALRPEFVEFIPETLDEGIIFVSRKYRTASHLCCCGCGLEVVTPLNAAKWSITENTDGTISLWPSVGNWSFPCKSHYIVTRGRVHWAGGFSAAQIAAIQAQDKHDTIAAMRPRSVWGVMLAGLTRAYRAAVDKLGSWWR